MARVDLEGPDGHGKELNTRDASKEGGWSPKRIIDALNTMLTEVYELLTTAQASADYPIVSAVIAGGAAGNLTVTGIATTDELISVTQFVGAGVAVTDVSDLTSEFTITAANTINNTGGTNTTGNKLLVLYRDKTA